MNPSSISSVILVLALAKDAAASLWKNWKSRHPLITNRQRELTPWDRFAFA
jgi:hypothetical protein